METLTDAVAELEIDVQSLTLGELADVEQASGYDASALMKRKSSQTLVLLYVARLRAARDPASPHYGKPPKWSELSSLRVLGVSSSMPPSRGDGDPQTSET